MPNFPLIPISNGRYLIDQNNTPFLYHADTGWRIFTRLTRDEVIVYLDDRKARGFNTLHVMVLVSTDWEGTFHNLDGEYPFVQVNGTFDFAQPNEKFWAHCDWVFGQMAERGFFVACAVAWLGYEHSGWSAYYGSTKMLNYGRFIGARYKHLKNVMWVLGGDADPRDRYEAIGYLAKGIKETAPHHLLTAHCQPENASAAIFGDESWLDVNWAYTYNHAHVQVYEEYSKHQRLRPIVLAETGYEDEANTGFPWTPYLVRRQAYWAMLSGACGHAYGSRWLWNFWRNWQDSLDKVGVQQLGHWHKLFASRAWWMLAPDRAHKFVTYGCGRYGNDNYVTAALADDRSFGMAYLPTSREVWVELRKLTGATVRATWFNPLDGLCYGPDGKTVKAHFAEYRDLSLIKLKPPELERPAGEDDWVLVLDAITDRSLEEVVAHEGAS
jgi:hypothetical protein